MSNLKYAVCLPSQITSELLSHHHVSPQKSTKKNPCAVTNLIFVAYVFPPGSLKHLGHLWEEAGERQKLGRL